MNLNLLSAPRALGLVLGTCLALLPSAVWAQGTIAGQVTDSTGSIVPGVIVEAPAPPSSKGLGLL